MANDNHTPEYAKVAFYVDQDEFGWPADEVTIETVWAERVDGDLILANIPFYAREVSERDVIEAEVEHGMLVFRRVKTRGGYGTLRIRPFKDNDGTSIIKDLSALGCEIERANDVISVSVPPHVTIAPVLSYLRDGYRNRVFDYQKADISWADEDDPGVRSTGWHWYIHRHPLSGRVTPGDNAYVRIAFDLEIDEDGWPLQPVESLWARRCESAYILDNTPYFIWGVSAGDLVEAEVIDGRLTFKEVIQWSGHSAIRLIIHDRANDKQVVSALAELGCNVESEGYFGLIAVDIPFDVELDPVFIYLGQGEKDGLFEYEEANVSWFENGTYSESDSTM